MQLLTDKVTIAELKEMAPKIFGNLVKAVVDIEKKIMVIDAEMHYDQECFLLENGSKQENLWGISLHPEQSGDEFIEFDSMINIRPRQNNRSRYVEDSLVRQEVIKVVQMWVKK